VDPVHGEDPDEAVEDLAHELPVEGLTAAHEVLVERTGPDRDGPGRQPLGQLDPLGQRRRQVRVRHEHRVAGRREHTGADRGSLSPIRSVPEESDRQVRGGRGALRDLGGSVGGAVVDDDHLPLPAAGLRAEPGGDAVDRTLDAAALVERRDDERRLSARRAGAHFRTASKTN